MGTTYNLPNYTGELFAISPEDTPFLAAIGGLTGGKSVDSTKFSWQTYDLRDADANRQRLEGADAPTPEGRVRSNAYNVLEIHQEQVSVSYTKQAATKLVGTGGATNLTLGANPVTDEFQWQVDQELKQVARDVDKSFIVGTFQEPSDNSTPRKTRGLLQAITTNVLAGDLPQLGSDYDLKAFEQLVLDLMQKVWDNGGISESETRTIITNSYLKRCLTAAFITNKGYQEESRNVGGVNLQTFETDFGKCNIMLERYMPSTASPATSGQSASLAVVSLEQCAPAFLEIPEKGHFFVEPLAKTGASIKGQLYGEIGLEYGNELAHGKLTLTADGANS